MKIWIFIFLFSLFGCATNVERLPASSFSDKTCIDLAKSIFSPSSVNGNQYSEKLANFKKFFTTIKPQNYGEHLKDKNVRAQFREIVQRISTPDEVFETLKMLHELTSVKRHYSLPNYKNELQPYEDLYVETIGSLISTSGLINKVLELKAKFTQEDQRLLMNSLNLIEKQIKSELEEDIISYQNRSIKVMILQFQMIFDLNFIHQYLNHILNVVSIGSETEAPMVLAGEYMRYLKEGWDYHLGYFSADTINIMTQLPPTLKKSLADELKSKMANVSKDQKEQRRNIELFLRILSNDDYSKMFRKVEKFKSMGEDAIVSLVDDSWKNSLKNTYSFKKVLESAKTLKKSPLSEWLHGDESILIYGSFPNGKANLGTSDLDVHVSSGTLERHQDSFDRWDLESRDFDSLRYQDMEKLQEIIARNENDLDKLEKTENLLAARWNRTGYKRGTFLTIVPSDSSFFELKSLGFYNSILVEVRPKGIVVYFVDMIQGNKVISVLINEEVR